MLLSTEKYPYTRFDVKDKTKTVDGQFNSIFLGDEVKWQEGLLKVFLVIP